MRLFCRWRQARLAREICANQSALSPSALSRHLVQCADCRCAREEMVRLNEELAQGFAIPLASEQFAQDIFEKIEARAVLPKRRVSLENVFLVGGCAAILLCIVLWRQSQQNPDIAPSLLAANSPVQRPTSTMPKKGRLSLSKIAVERSPISTQAEPKPKNVARIVRKKRKLHFASHSTRKPYRRYRSLAWQPQIQPRTAILSPEMRSVRWTQWANFYENHGDYAQAANAYARAYNAVPTESTAFCAGQAAENAGDVSQAVLYYSQILRQPLKQKPQPEKGTRIWNSAHDAA